MPAAAHGIIEGNGLERCLSLPFQTGPEHLLAELARLRLLMHREVLRLRAAGFFTDDQFRGLYVSDEQADAILSERYSQNAGENGPGDFPPVLSEISRRIQTAREEISAREEASRAAGIPLPLAQLVNIFSLSAFERDALLLCVAVEIDLQFETLCSYAQNDVTRKRPTPDLISRLLCGSFEERLERRAIFSVTGNLLGSSLVRFAETAPEREPPLLARPLKAEERTIEFLLGRPGPDARLRPFTTQMDSGPRLVDLHLPDLLSMELMNAAGSCGTEGGFFFFQGAHGTGRRAAAAALSAAMNRSLLVADLQRAHDIELPLATALPLLRREALLAGANLYLARAESLLGNPPAPGQSATLLADDLLVSGLLIFVETESPWSGRSHSVRARNFSFEFPIPAYTNRIRLWQQAIREADCPSASDVDLPTLAGKFVLTGGEIQAACREAKYLAPVRGAGQISMADLEAAARSQSNHGLRRLAQKVNPTCQWHDLVLPPRALRQLREISASAKHRYLVYSKWGFERRLALGKGLNVLFHGLSGTGKTMAAGILAQQFGLDLYKIDLSSIVSKYIGETEKQLNQIFREARSSNAILFFDEADALFGKRSEVKDAHDRYANIEVAYLLQKMEEYEGIVILATNFRKNMDEAFTRRMHHIVEFPFPDASYRERIWKSLIPSDAPLAPDVNFGFLARQFELAGGNIRNVVLAAAFLAAEENSVIRMEHMILATSRELQKLGKLPGRGEFREYYEMIRAGE